MTDGDSGTNLLAIYVQLTPWVQVSVAFMGCVLLLGVAYLFKETVATLTQPFIRPQPPPRRALAPAAMEMHDDRTPR